MILDDVKRGREGEVFLRLIAGREKRTVQGKKGTTGALPHPGLARREKN